MVKTETIKQSDHQWKNLFRGGHKSQGHSFRLEFLDGSKCYVRGEGCPFIDDGDGCPFSDDRVILGRGEYCQVRFSDCPTVSSEHAAIEWIDKQWMLVHLSKTNPTYLNGIEIDDRKPLITDDEIMLSKGGPHLKFRTRGYSTASIGGIIRSAVRRAIKPYKRIIIALSLLMLTIVVSGILWTTKKNVENKKTFFEASNSIYLLKISEKNNKETVGTGFLTDDGRLVTAWHVLDNPNRNSDIVIAYGVDTLALPIKEFHHDTTDITADWAWIEVDRHKGEGLPIIMNLDAIRDSVCCFDGYGLKGFRDRLHYQRTGKITGVAKKHNDEIDGILFKPSPKHGDSGSPLLVKIGDTVKVCGIVSEKKGVAIPIQKTYTDK